MWKGLLYFLFPSRCILCGTEGEDLCPRCRKDFVPAIISVSSDTWAFFPYADQRVKILIHAYKYKKKRALAEFMANTFAENIDHIIQENAVVIVPIPSSPKHKHERSLHTLLLAQCVAKTYRGKKSLRVDPCIEKRKETVRQVETKNRAERLENLVDAFSLKKGVDIQGKTILLLDDVTTTGATFAEARRALEGAGAKKVLAVALAH